MIESLIAAYNLYWAGINLYNEVPLLYKLVKDKLKKNEEREGENLSLEEHPDIYVILAAYREEKVLPHSVKKFVETPYNGKKKLYLALEEDDEETQKVGYELKEKYPDIIETLIVGKDEKDPKGKPRALNRAFRKISEEIEKIGREEKSIVGVLDAEDIIDEKLLYEVSYKLSVEDYDAIQGILDMTNDHDGWKNLEDRATYGWWFRKMLPAKSDSGLPLPFGGTTNFFKYKVLKEIAKYQKEKRNIDGPWDSYNLTEDFDLGMLMYQKFFKIGALESITIEDIEKEFKLGRYKIGTISSTTKEESPLTWKGWFKQKTRWEQGKLQTLKKMLKEIYHELKEMRIKEAFHPRKIPILLECLTPHLGAINLSGIGLSIYSWYHGYDLGELSPLFLYNIASIGFYSALNGFGYYLAAKDDEGKSKKELIKNSIKAVVYTPAYWLAYWLADLRAMKREYIGKLKNWEKTSHEGRHLQERSQKETPSK